tara:strand:- start:102 stop:329 length:228 start_codon:yes stop_codon:yes gene_type:complete
MTSSLAEFAQERQAGTGGSWAWHMTLDDDLFNEIWDVFQNDRFIGVETIVAWLRYLGHTDVTTGKVKTIRLAKRR